MTSTYLLITVMFAVLITLLLVRIGVFKSRKAAISNGVPASGNMPHETSVSRPEVLHELRKANAIRNEFLRSLWQGTTPDTQI